MFENLFCTCGVNWMEEENRAALSNNIILEDNLILLESTIGYFRPRALVAQKGFQTYKTFTSIEKSYKITEIISLVFPLYIYRA